MKKIVLYGTGIEGEKFYWAYRDCYEIVFCIDRMCYRSFHNLSVYDFDEIAEELKKKDYFIVVAAGSDAYREISDKLRKIGLKEYRDYIESTDIGKKLAIVYGNCHMDILSEYLSNNPTVRRQYIVKYYWLSSENLPEEVLKICELLILQDIRKENEGHYIDAESLCNMVNQDCLVIKVPNVYGKNFFFPQIDITRGEERYGLARKEVFERHVNQNAVIMYDKRNVFKFGDIMRGLVGDKGGDENIERLYREKKSVREIADYIEYGEAYDAEMVRGMFEREMRKLIAREKECDISISDYILENYQSKQLFYEPMHPTNELIKEKGRRILKLLNIEIDESVPLKRATDGGEVFIYGCVKKALHINFEQKYIKKWTCKTYSLKGHPMDLEEYVDNYIKWCCEEE